jgi:hypothetical protein
VALPFLAVGCFFSLISHEIRNPHRRARIGQSNSPTLLTAGKSPSMANHKMPTPWKSPQHLLHPSQRPSHEIRITPQPDGKLTLQTANHEFTAEVVDPRAWSGRRHGHVEAQGRQQIIAPMAR